MIRTQFSARSRKMPLMTNFGASVPTRAMSLVAILVLLGCGDEEETTCLRPCAADEVCVSVGISYVCESACRDGCAFDETCIAGGVCVLDEEATVVRPPMCGDDEQPCVKGLWASKYTTCAALVDDSLWCWGDYMLQYHDFEHNPAPTPVQILAVGSLVLDVAVGDGRLWIVRADGQLDVHGTSSGEIRLALDSLPAISAISLGWTHGCAISQEGKLFCWGDDAGVHSIGDNAVEISELSDVTDVATGDHHTCVVHDGKVSCWGVNTFGQIGDGTRSTRQRPVLVLDDGATSVSAAGNRSCAVHGQGRLSCWGKSNFAEYTYYEIDGEEYLVGIDPFDDWLEPNPRLRSEEVALDVNLGDDHSCVMLETNHVKCFGLNKYGQLGNEGSGDSSFAPIRVPTGVVDRVATGASHGCATQVSGAIVCWGHNGMGQLGDGTTVNRGAPDYVVW